MRRTGRTLRTTALALVLALLLPMLPAAARAAETSGKCGADAAWAFDSGTGVLTVSGTGETWGNPTVPDTFPETVISGAKQVLFDEGITSVGSSMFEGWPQLRFAQTAATVTVIFDRAFAGCGALKRIGFSNGSEAVQLKRIGTSAFEGAGLTQMWIPEDVTVDDRAFADCKALETVLFDSGDHGLKTPCTIFSTAFTGCENLKTLYYPYDGTAWSGVILSTCGAPSASWEPYTYPPNLTVSVSGVTPGNTVDVTLSGSDGLFSGTGAASSANYLNTDATGSYAVSNPRVNPTGSQLTLSLKTPAGVLGKTTRFSGLRLKQAAFGVTVLEQTGREGADIRPAESVETCFEITFNTGSTPEASCYQLRIDWEDDNDSRKLRPNSIKVQLGLRDGTTQEHTVTAANEWTLTLGSLDAKQVKTASAAGTIANYRESGSSGSGTGDSYFPTGLTFAYQPRATDLRIIWNDNDNAAKKRPESVTVGLVQDDKAPTLYEIKPLPGSSSWGASWEELSRDSKWTIVTVNVPEGYQASVKEDPADQWTIVYTYLKAALLNKTATVVWNDGSDAAKARPSSVEIQLLMNGQPLGPVSSPSAQSLWKCGWSGLNAAETWTIRPSNVENYTCAIQETDSGWTVTYTYQAAPLPPALTDKTVTVVWNDSSDAAKARPSSVEIRLLQNGKVSKTASLSQKNGWKHDWTGLSAADAWAVTPAAVANYTAVVKGTTEGWTVTYTYQKPADPPATPSRPSTPSTPSRPSTPSTPSNPGTGKKPGGVPVRNPGSKPEKEPAAPGTTPTQTPTQTPAQTPSGDPAVSQIPFQEIVTPPAKNPESPIQGQLKTDGPHPDWRDRVTLPDYGKTLYDVLVEGSRGTGETLADCLLRADCFQVDPKLSGQKTYGYQVTRIEAAEFALTDAFGAASPLGAASFQSGDFYTVAASAGDRGIDYGSLRMGDVVRTASFNGVFVARTPRDGGFDARKKEMCSYISAVFQAFDRDHPEVFWLSGKCKVRMIAVQKNGVQEVCFFLVLADKDFTMCAPAWRGAGAIEQGIRRRDAAVSGILATVNGSTAGAKVSQLNAWLTQHNQYNTSKDLTAIGNEPHESLSALEGRTGTSGPVCDGYARAFKVLCDRLGIPCVLECGYARTSPQSKGGYHMWNSVQVGQSWYGVDVTWNDPTVKGVNNARSGYENEKFLLVGSSTEILGMTFAASHPVSNQPSSGGMSFLNGPTLSPIAYTAMTQSASTPAAGTPEKEGGTAPVTDSPLPSASGGPVLSLTDVKQGDPYAEAIEYVCKQGLMQGDRQKRFQPNAGVTCRQAWSVLARLDGVKPSSMAEAVSWARERGVSDGTEDPTAVMTRQQMALFLYRCRTLAGCTLEGTMDLSAFDDGGTVGADALEAVSWAAAGGILVPGAGCLAPEKGASRGQLAQALLAFCQG